MGIFRKRSDSNIQLESFEAKQIRLNRESGKTIKQLIEFFLNIGIIKICVSLHKIIQPAIHDGSVRKYLSDEIKDFRLYSLGLYGGIAARQVVCSHA